jgi:hypothetical protein
MRTYTILPKTGDWNDIPVAPIDTRLWTPEIDISATAQVCYDADALYVRLTAKEKNIRAEETDIIGMPCKDSCLEFFFSPEEGDGRYFNIEFNPAKCMYMGLGTCRYDSARILPAPTANIEPLVTRTDNGWEITYKITTEFIKIFFPNFTPVTGKKMRANFYKCGDLTSVKHYFSWNPVDISTPDFHRPEFFGELIFG